MNPNFKPDRDLAVWIARHPDEYDAAMREEARRCLLRFWMQGSSYRQKEAGAHAQRLLDYKNGETT